MSTVKEMNIEEMEQAVGGIDITGLVICPTNGHDLSNMWPVETKTSEDGWISYRKYICRKCGAPVCERTDYHTGEYHFVEEYEYNHPVF